MQISRMELADFGSPERIMQGILDQVPDMPCPVPVEDVALSLDVTEIAPMRTAGFEGGLITDTNKSEGVILVNRDSLRQRQRYTIGHELGHFLLPLHLPVQGEGSMCTAADMRRTRLASPEDRAVRMEVEANRFSANLLMPAPWFRRDIAKAAAMDLDLLLHLARKYDSSKEATGHRFVELGDVPCAVVFSRHGQYLYGCWNHGFPFISLKRGDPIPQNALTRSHTGVVGTVSDMEQVDAHWWIDAEPYCNGWLWEQTLPQANGYRLTLLQLGEEEMEEADEEEELVEAYTPRFRRR